MKRSAGSNLFKLDYIPVVPVLPVVSVLSVVPVLALAACILLPGCAAVGPDYTPPEIEMPDAWHANLLEGLEEGEADLHTWWNVFDDPVLEKLIQRAAAGNLDLKEALARIDEARARLGVAEGEFYPDIDADASFSRSRFSEELAEGMRVTDRNVYSVGFDATWELDVFGRIRRSVESANASLQASVENYRDVLVILFAEVARAYIDIRSLEIRVRLAVDNAELQRKTLGLVQERFDNGLVPKLDVTQAQSNLAITEALIPFLEIQRIEAFNRLSVLMGEQPGKLQEALDLNTDASVTQDQIEKEFPAASGQVLVGLPAELLRQRPDVRRVERELASQTAQIGVATADLYPRFSLTGFFAYQARDNNKVFDAQSRAYSIGPSIRWNIFDGWRIQNNIKAEEALTDQTLFRYKNTVLFALEEVENSISGYAKESLRAQALERAVVASKESVELVQTLYLDGLTDFQNVLDSQRSLREQQDILWESKGAVSKILINLYKSLGGGWSAATTVADSGEEGQETEEEGPETG